MACKGICDNYAVLGIALRDWNYDPDLMRCSTCDVIIHRDNWIITQARRIICPCCRLQLKANSRGKIARERRQKEYWNKIEAR